METTLELQKKVAYLEFVHDQLITEIEEVNSLLVAIGFPNGIRSITMVAHEVIEEEVQE